MEYKSGQYSQYASSQGWAASQSYRIYTARELDSIAPQALRPSAPPPKKGFSFSGVFFLIVLAATLGGATFGAQRFMDREAERQRATTKVDPPAAAATPPPPPAATTLAPSVPVTADSAPPSSATTKPKPPLASSATTVKKKPPKPAASGSGAASEKPPPNPYDDDALRLIDRGSRSKP
jgi:hypothetical protein